MWATYVTDINPWYPEILIMADTKDDRLIIIMRLVVCFPIISWLQNMRLLVSEKITYIPTKYPINYTCAWVYSK